MPDVSNNAAKRLNEDEQLEIYDWLSGLGNQGEIEVTLKRQFPPHYKGVQVKGTLAKFDEPIDEEFIQNTYGGGKFQVVVKTKNEKGQWGYTGARTFDVAGNPKIDALPGVDAAGPAPAPRESDTAVRHAMDMAQNIARQAEERARQAESRSGTDVAMLEHLLAPLRSQIDTLQRQLDSKDNRIHELVSKPIDRSQEDRLLGVLENKDNNYAAQIATIRANHDSELRQLRENHREEIKEKDRRTEKEVDNIHKSAQREIDAIKLAHTQALESQRQAYEMRIETLKESNARSERELTEARQELVALREKKELSPTQQLEGLLQLKTGFDAVFHPGGGDDDEKSKSGIERALDTVLNSPIAEGIATRFAAAGMAQQAAAGMPDLVMVRTADGQVVQVPRHIAEEMQRRQQAAAAGEDGESQPDEPRLDPKDVERAVSFIEAAMRNNTDAEMLARSARNMIPANILSYLKHRGVDHFLNDVAKLKDGSPLATVAGRVYVRKVAKFLLEGTTEGVEDDQPVSPVESP